MEETPPSMNVVLIGMKHCGKSTLGAALAVRWGCPFYDVDQIIEATHACDTGEPLTVRELFTAQGEACFQTSESQAVQELYLRLHRRDTPSVVAVGGRTALNPQVRDLLKDLGQIVYLQVSPEELFARVERAGLPPFVGPVDPAQDFFALYCEREPYYRQQADLVVNVDGQSVEEAVEVLAHCLEEYASSMLVSVQVAPTPGPSPNLGGRETPIPPAVLPPSPRIGRGAGGEGLNGYQC